MTKSSLEDLWKETVKLREAKDFAASISMCQRALARSVKEGQQEFARAFKAELATALVDSGVNEPSNIERAISVYKQLEKEIEKTTHPELAGWTKRGLGDAYLKRTGGDAKQNLLQAVEYHKDALALYSLLKDALICASVRTSLGRAYRGLATLGDAKLMDEAIHQARVGSWGVGVSP